MLVLPEHGIVQPMPDFCLYLFSTPVLVRAFPSQPTLQSGSWFCTVRTTWQKNQPIRAFRRLLFPEMFPYVVYCIKKEVRPESRTPTELNCSEGLLQTRCQREFRAVMAFAYNLLVPKLQRHFLGCCLCLD